MIAPSIVRSGDSTQPAPAVTLVMGTSHTMAELSVMSGFGGGDWEGFQASQGFKGGELSTQAGWT